MFNLNFLDYSILLAIERRFSINENIETEPNDDYILR